MSGPFCIFGGYMQITLYSNFSKRVKSTKQPTSGTTVTLNIKEPQDIENPSFQLSGGISSYENVTAVKWGSRYYFVTGITSDLNGVTTISCTKDRMATFKSSILAGTAFIERSSTIYSDDIPDPMASSTDNIYYETSEAATQVFPKSDSDISGFGYCAVHVITTDTCIMNGDGTGVYFFPLSGLSDYSSVKTFLQKIFDGNLINDFDGMIQGSYNAIIKCVYVPVFGVDSIENTGGPDYELRHPYIGTRQYLDVDALAAKSGSAFAGLKHTIYSFNIGNIAHYPMNGWLNKDPYSQWYIYLPYYGTIQFSPDEFLTDIYHTMRIDAYLDVTTGDITYIRSSQQIASPYEKTILDIYRTSCGVNIPLSQIMSTGLPQLANSIMSVAGSSIGVAAGIATGNFALAGGAAVGALPALAQGIVSPFKKSVSATPGGGSLSVQMANIEAHNKIKVFQVGKEVAPLDFYGTHGGPLMESATLSTHAGGFVKCSNAAVAIPGTLADKEYVNNALNSGAWLD